MRIRANLAFERELWGRGVTTIAGVDEVGVGAFAGPVIAAAVVLASDQVIDGLADSKLLGPKTLRASVRRDQAPRVYSRMQHPRLSDSSEFWRQIGLNSKSTGSQAQASKASAERRAGLINRLSSLAPKACVGGNKGFPAGVLSRES